MDKLVRKVDAVDRRDPFTGGHSRRVAELVEGTLRELGVHGPEAALIVAAARFHDIGVDELMLVMQMGTVPHELVMESLRTFGEKVMPHFG